MPDRITTRVIHRFIAAGRRLFWRDRRGADGTPWVVGGERVGTILPDGSVDLAAGLEISLRAEQPEQSVPRGCYDDGAARIAPRLSALEERIAALESAISPGPENTAAMQKQVAEKLDQFLRDFRFRDFR